MTSTATPADGYTTALARLEIGVHDTDTDQPWRAAITEGLFALRDSLDPSVSLLRQVRHDAPRLSGAIGHAGRQHDLLTNRINWLLADGAASALSLNAEVRLLLSDVRGYRRCLATLLYEAYNVDLGGET